MGVSVLRRSRARGATVVEVRQAARRVLQEVGEHGAELVVNLVDADEMRALNRDYRKRDRATDVLAFAMREGERVAGDDGVLGDVVISLPAAAAQACQDGTSTAAAVRRLLIHGILHLLGYDHERSAAEAKRMRAMERKLRAALEASPSKGPRTKS
jgi:probable rRNA maturation factor